MRAKLTSDQFRTNFPVLADTVHLASCSQGALSGELLAALTETTFSMRERGAPWQEWMAEVDQARRGFAELIGASPDEVALVHCASDGAYQAASTQDYSTRPVVVTTDMEFPSVGHVWLAQAARGAKVFVDAYQATGVIPVDVRELGCDYLVSGALKYMLGLPGVAFLYARSGVTDDLPPQLTGWFGRVDPFPFDPRTVDSPQRASRFETGTPGIPAVYAANAGMRLLSRVDMEAVGRHVTAPRGAVLRLSFHHFTKESDVDAVCSAIADYRADGRVSPEAGSDSR